MFETLAMEIPILLGVNGEARFHFVDKAQAAIFVEPENAAVLAENVLLLADNPELAREMGKKGRKYAESQFNRDVIASNFLKTLNA